MSSLRDKNILCESYFLLVQDKPAMFKFVNQILVLEVKYLNFTDPLCMYTFLIC